MNFIAFTFVTMVAALGLVGCDWQSPTAPTKAVTGSGVLVTETRAIGPISEVSVSGACHLVIDQHGPESVEITAEDNILPQLRVEVSSGRLVLGPGPGANFQATRGVVFRVGARAIRVIEASGASLVETANLDVDDLAIRLSGASAARVAGAASALLMQGNGSSHIVATGLASPDVRVAVSGTSYARVRSQQRLSISASGVSVVEYFGNPVLVLDVSGLASVRRVGL